MLKNLMVHLDQSERSKIRLEIAVDIAKQHGARLVGVFGQRALAKTVGVITSWPPAEYVHAANESKLNFEMATAGLNAEWIDVNRGSDSALLAFIPEKARYFDLIIMGQHDDSVKAFSPPELPEEVVLHSGRPVLIIPYVGSFNAKFKHPLIAWNNSRDSAHALNDALPLIKNCDEAVVLSFDTKIEQAEKTCHEVARHLNCHSIKTRTEAMVIDDVGVMDMLLNNASDQGADILVMGAHSQHNLPFASRGAGTRYILRVMVLPILMSS